MNAIHNARGVGRRIRFNRAYKRSETALFNRRGGMQKAHAEYIRICGFLAQYHLAQPGRVVSSPLYPSED